MLMNSILGISMPIVSPEGVGGEDDPTSSSSSSWNHQITRAAKTEPGTVVRPSVCPSPVLTLQQSAAE